MAGVRSAPGGLGLAAAGRRRAAAAPRAGAAARSPAAPAARSSSGRPTEQANVILGTLGLTANDERRYVLSVLNAVLGGGMSSRLFQEIRERRGLAYSVYSFASGYSDAGWFGLYAGCAPRRSTRSSPCSTPG